jgi:hypothetical protein
MNYDLLVESQNQSYFTTGSLSPISSSWQQAPWESRPVILFSNWTLAIPVPIKHPTLTRWQICRLQFLLVLASAVILTSESRGTHNHILLSQTRDSPNLECQVPVFISSRRRVSISSPPTTRRAAVEVFDPASTRDLSPPTPTDSFFSARLLI